MASNGRINTDTTGTDNTSVFGRRKEYGNPLGAAFTSPQTFSGADISVIFTIPLANSIYAPLHEPMKLMAEMQTITISSASSLAPVRSCGWSKARAYNKGARTFAGTMVFTVINKDPFQEIFALDALNNSVAQDGHWHIDQMPPFDIILVGSNETGGIGVQVLHDVMLSHWGTTYSIDDVFTESTYTYVAEHVTPFVFDPLNIVRLYDVLSKTLGKRNAGKDQTPDDIIDKTESLLSSMSTSKTQNSTSLNHTSTIIDPSQSNLITPNGFSRTIKETTLDVNKLYLVNNGYGSQGPSVYQTFGNDYLQQIQHLMAGGL